MLDIFGNELNRGDIIVYGHSPSTSRARFSNTKLGVISNIVPSRERTMKVANQARVSLANTILGSGFSGNTSIPNTAITYTTHKITTVEKVVFYELMSDEVIRQYYDRYKNGRPKNRRVILTTSCLKIDYSMMSDDWKMAYDTFIKEFKIC